MKLGILHQLLRQMKIKRFWTLLTHFGAKNRPYLPPKTAFLAHFEIIDGIYLFFQYPIWTKLGTLHQLLRLMKIKTVSDTSNSFLGPKWTIFVPKTAFLAHFEMEFLYFSISNMDETWHTSSTYKLEVSETVFLSSSALKVDDVCQVSSILEVGKIEKFHHLSQNEPKTQFLGQKWAIFDPKMSQKCLKLFLIFVNLKS